MSYNKYRKCAVCGATAMQDATVPFHRFPKADKNNLLRLRVWAKYCWPEEKWLSAAGLAKLYKTSKVICGRHFELSAYTDSSRRRLTNFSFPGDTEFISNMLPKLEQEMHLIIEDSVFESNSNLLRSALTTSGQQRTQQLTSGLSRSSEHHILPIPTTSEQERIQQTMALRRVLIVNKTFPKAGLELLQNKMKTIVLPYTDDMTDSLPQIKSNINGIEALIWNTKHKLTKELLDLAGSQLKAVSTMSSGVDQVDVDEMKNRKIPLGNTPKVLDNAVADIAVGLLIAAARRFKEAVTELETGEWKYGVQWMVGKDIAGSTVGLIGLGGIGQAIVRRLSGFDVAHFLYTGRAEKPEAKELGAKYVPLKNLLQESDYIIVACPLTSQTKHLINIDTIQLMKQNAVIINIARGEIIDQDALINALKEKRIFAAGLDVVTPEPISKDHPLVNLPNCYVLPHMGSATVDTRNEMAKISANNILLALQSKPMMSPAY